MKTYIPANIRIAIIEMKGMSFLFMDNFKYASRKMFLIKESSLGLFTFYSLFPDRVTNKFSRENIKKK